MSFFTCLRTLGALAVSLGLPLYGAAQTTQSSELGRDRSNNFNNGYAMAPANANEVQGSPFLLPRWETANVQLISASQPLVSVPLKYDLYRQELRVRRPKGDSVIVPLAQVREFSLSNALPARRFVCYPAATLPAEVGGACAEVLTEGTHLQLLKFRHKQIVRQAGEGGGYASATSISALEEQTHYYVRWVADGRFTLVRLKRASLEQALAGQPAALAALKARKGSLGSEADMAAAIAAIDPLLAGLSK